MARPTELERTRQPATERTRGLVSAPVRAGDIASQLRPAPAQLSDVVARMWGAQWDLRGHDPHRTQLLGDPCVHVVFEAGASRLVGVWTQLWQRTLSDAGRIRAATIHAGAIRALLPAPAHHWTNRIVALGTAFEGTVDAVEPRVLVDDDDAGFGALVDWLQAQRQPHDRQAIRTARALVDQATNDPSIVSVKALADRASMSVRAVQRLFRDDVGASPKWVIRRLRLQEVATQIERGRSPNLARLAVELGYADHAHLTRDFKNAVGQTPTQFARSLDQAP